MNDLDERLERAALDLNVDSCNPAKWIMDMVWLNLARAEQVFPILESR